MPLLAGEGLKKCEEIEGIKESKEGRKDSKEGKKEGIEEGRKKKGELKRCEGTEGMKESKKVGKKREPCCRPIFVFLHFI